jgi:hypothetical protein
VVSGRELENRPYQPLRATGHGDANGLMSATAALAEPGSYQGQGQTQTSLDQRNHDHKTPNRTLAITGGCR